MIPDHAFWVSTLALAFLAFRVFTLAFLVQPRNLHMLKKCLLIMFCALLSSFGRQMRTIQACTNGNHQQAHSLLMAWYIRRTNIKEARKLIVPSMRNTAQQMQALQPKQKENCMKPLIRDLAQKQMQWPNIKMAVEPPRSNDLHPTDKISNCQGNARYKQSN